MALAYATSERNELVEAFLTLGCGGSEGLVLDIHPADNMYAYLLRDQLEHRDGALVSYFRSGWSAARLVWDLLHSSPTATVATDLLLSGALVWMQTVLAFGFLYWELDGGGAVNRHLRPRPHPDLAFPQQLEPELAPPGWRPVFADYLSLALTNATTFGPADVLPLARWAKLTMAVQSLLSLVILGLVVANAVNLL